MPTFDSYDVGPSEYDVQSNKKENKVSGMSSSANFLPKVFGIMFIGLLITAVIAAIGGYLLLNLAQNATTEEEVDAIAMGMLVTMAISAIGLIVLSIVIPLVTAKGKRSVLVPLILYTVFMGVLLSSFTIALDPWVLAEAAGMTALSFGAISLIGFIGKGRIPGLGLLISGLFIGIIFMSITNLILMLTGAINDNSMYVWIVDFAFLALVMLVSIYDLRQIKDISNSASELDNNTVLYCAFIMYSSVISIFVRIAYLLAKVKSK